MPLRYSTISSADVPENIMQQFWKILDICPRKEGEDFTEVQNDEDTLTFLIDLGYSDFQQYGLAIPATMLNNKIIQSESYKMFILYSTGQIPPKKSRGKGSQGKKTADTTEESVDVSDESDPEPLIRRKTSRRKVVKKKATISVDDNIIPEPDIALELGKSISLAEAEEEAAAREVHDTHARIVTESVPEPARTIRQSSIAFRDTSSVSKKRTSGTSQKLKGIQSLTPAEQEATDIMKALKDSKKMIGRQPGTGGSDEGTGEIPGVSDELIFVDAEDDNEETESDFEDIYKYRINVRKKLNIFSVRSDYGNQFLNLSHDEESNKQPPVLQQTTPTPTTNSNTTINTKAPTITNNYPEINHSCPSLESPQLEKIMSEVKKIDHSTTTAQESEKSPEEIIRIKRELEEKKQEPTYTIKSTDKAALEEFDLKSALFKSMHKNKSANRNPANYILYHALMEALIEDENAMDKEVADTVKDHKRKHDGDDDDDDDDEGPPSGSNQGKSTKNRRKREYESAKKPSTTKESSTGKDLKVGSRTGKSAPAKDPVEEPTDKVIMDEQPTEDIPISDEGIGKEELSKSDLEGPAFMMVKSFHENIISLQFQMEEWELLSIRLPLTPPGQVTIQPQLFFNKDLEYLLTGDKERNRALSISKLKAALYQDFGLEELVLSLWIESEREYDINAAYGITYGCVIRIKTYERYGYNYLREIVLRRAEYNEYKILEKDFKSLHPNNFEDLNILYIQGKLDCLPKQDKVHLHNADSSDFPFKEDYTIVFKPRAVIYRDRDDNRKMMRINEVHKFSDGTLTRIKENLDFMVKDFKLFKFNKGMENRKCLKKNKKRSEDVIEVIRED
ncbi:hypothetical protein Tco_0004145 [Tanacetum coccineum]